MSAVLEKLTKRVVLLRTKREETEANIAVLEQEIPQLEQRVEEARKEAIRANPAERPGGKLDSELRRAERTLKKAVTRHSGFVKDLAAFRVVEAEVGAERSEAELRTRMAELSSFDKREFEGHRKAGELLAQLHEVWLSEVVAPIEERDRYVGEAIAAGLVDGADPELRGEWKRTSKPPIEPVAQDFEEYVTRLVLVTTDHLGMGYRDERREGTQRVDHGNRLKELTPDLRPTNRNVQVSGRVEVTAGFTTRGQQPNPIGSMLWAAGG